MTPDQAGYVPLSPDTARACEAIITGPGVPCAADFDSAAAHISAALRALGAPPRDPADDRDTARRVSGVRPGVSASHALAVIEVLRASGRGPDRAGQAEAKLAALTELCKDPFRHIAMAGCCLENAAPGLIRAEDVMAIIDGEAAAG